MAKKAEPRFAKSQIVRSARYREQIDLVNALLHEDDKYTLAQVDKIIDEYLKKEVQ